MTGLCVAASFDGSAVTADLMRTMAAPAAHRGSAAAAGIWAGEGAAAAQLTRHPRLRPSDAPEVVVDDGLVCVADARIDAAAGLFADTGVRRRSAAAVALAAYRRWETSCAAHMIGDFAFVIWDTDRRRLFAARDPMGARTLYHRVEPRRRVLIASEAKQLLAVADVPRRLHEAALLADIAGLFALPEMTPYDGVDQLAPGHALTVDADGSRLWRYWDIDHDRRPGFDSPQEYAAQFRRLFTTAVQDRLASGTTGLFLSGGLDSTAMAATAATVAAPAGLQALSWAFDEVPAADERAVSAPLAAHLGIPVLDVPADEVWPLSVSTHVPDADDPYSSLFDPLFERSLLAARDAGIGVLLTGERGDEMTGNWVYDELGLLLSGCWSEFGDDYRAFGSRTAKSGVRFVRERLAGPLMTSLWPPGSFEGLRRQVRRFAGSQPKPLAPWVPTAAAQRLGLHDIMDAAMPIPPVRGHARLQRYMSVFDVISLRTAQLRSRSWARHGLEYADPWGDRRIAEFVCAAPQWVVQRQSQPKRLVREAMVGVLEDSARLQPAPSGFPVMFDLAFKHREVETVRALLRDSRAEAAGLLDAGAVLGSYEHYLAGGDLAHDFWFPLTVELWLRRWWD